MTLTDLVAKVGSSTKIYIKYDVSAKFELAGTAADLRDNEANSNLEVVVFSASAGRLNVRVKDIA
jgi:hypothetical protein